MCSQPAQGRKKGLARDVSLVSSRAGIVRKRKGEYPRRLSTDNEQRTADALASRLVCRLPTIATKAMEINIEKKGSKGEGEILKSRRMF